MRRLTNITYVLVPLVGCAASPSAPPRSTATMQVATGETPAASTDPTGRWSGPEWGEVALNHDGTGTYSDTYGTGPGRIEFHAAGDGYDGRWRESDRRFGTMHFTLTPGGREIVGRWAPDPECSIGSMSGGVLHWMRAEPSGT